MSRKYRHSGYQDNDRDDNRNHRRGRTGGGGFLDDQPSRSARDPRERTGPKPSEPDRKDRIFRCHLCGSTIPNPEEIGREDQCPNCEADLWCCRGCQFFDPQARFECRQDIEEPVKKKAARNECALFKPRMVLDTSGKSKANSGFFGGEGDEVGRKAFEALFGDD